MGKSIGDASKNLDLYELEEVEPTLPSPSEGGGLVPHPVVAEDSSLGVTAHIDGAVTVHCDNTAALDFVKDPKFHGKAKHIGLRYHFIRTLVAQGEVTMKHIPTGRMVVDPLTKPIARDSNVRFQAGTMRVTEKLRGAQKKPVGILHVKIVQACNLLNKDFLGTSDPYVKLGLSGERLPSKKTFIKMNNLNSEWHEVFKFTVKDPQSQVLEVHVNDWEKVGPHDIMGRQIVLLRLLIPHEMYEFTLNLVKNTNPNDLHNKKPR
ncbi:hypothetical protein RJ640_018011 [Escallonia rubra]|uniref:C2 domain-containing protein n=1 Tax=Escallonia rubra TaxID=112253 RepID=A0AA88RSS3_9ASTE|nr:hypothetical protein RJ640_018011 [Escallonia rubra]